MMVGALTRTEVSPSSDPGLRNRERALRKGDG